MPNCETCETCETCKQPILKKPILKKPVPTDYTLAVRHYDSMQIKDHAVHNLRIMVQALTEAGLITYVESSQIYEKLNYNDYLREV